MDDIETPFPIEGRVELVQPGVIKTSIPCITEWLTEHESGNILDRIKREMETHHESGVVGDFIAHESGIHEITGVYPVEEAPEA